MSFRDQETAALESLGYTTEEARFIYLVAIHSGYFMTRQFLSFMGAKRGNRCYAFEMKLESRGHATRREYHQIGCVYHLFSTRVYRFIDKQNLPPPRRHAVEFIRKRLLHLDFILEHLGFAYFETEAEKTAYFCGVLGIPKTVLPAKTYGGPLGGEPAVRYFVDRFPMYLDPTVPHNPPVITFSYIDAGVPSVRGFLKHVKAYLPLLRWLERFSFLYIASSAAHFTAVEKCFSNLVRDFLQPGLSADVLRYFKLRNAWELKQYSSLSTSDVEWLKEASRRFAGEWFERSYRAWASGTLSDEALRTGFEQLHAHGQVSFSTCLTPVWHFGKNRAVRQTESALRPSLSSDAGGP
jgi:hypothetical protein